jgi:hypothetical protein
VKDSPELRAAVEEVQPENVALGLRLGQSQPLYKAYKVRGKGGGGAGVGGVEEGAQACCWAAVYQCEEDGRRDGCGHTWEGSGGGRAGHLTHPTAIPPWLVMDT